MKKFKANRISSLRDLVGSAFMAVTMPARKTLSSAPRFTPAHPIASVCAHFGIRERHVLNRNGRLRLRFVAAPVSCLALLLGSTARGIVPGARCDVLAVKVDCKS